MFRRFLCALPAGASILLAAPPAVAGAEAPVRSAGAIPATPTSYAPAPPLDADALQAGIEEALRRLDLDLTPAQITQVDDYVPVDTARLPWIRQMLGQPLALPVSVDGFARRLEAAAGHQDWPGFFQALESALLARDPGALRASSPGPLPATHHAPPPAAAAGLRKGPDHERVEHRVRTLDARVRTLMATAFAAWPADTLQWIYRNIETLVEEDLEDPEKDLFTLERETEEAQATQDRLLRHLERLDRSALLAAGRETILGLQTLREIATEYDAHTGDAEPRGPHGEGGQRNPQWGRAPAPQRDDTRAVQFRNGATARGVILASGESASGPWVVGGRGDNVYTGAFLCILDLGGQDLYDDDPAPSQPWLGPRWIVDLEGDDRYLASAPGAQGGGYFGVSVCLDVEGDDLYSARRIAQGAGYLGCGWLLDLDGADVYTATTFVQGAGFFGTGALIDLDGADTYSCGLYGQGFGFPSGVGTLLDAGGNDRYGITSVLVDLLRHGDGHAIAFNQGASLGLRPDISGGVGLLVDRAGHDIYQSDTFGQASSYFYGLGALVDREGHDVYDAFVYAQGAGVHYGVAVLLDQDGNDRYLSKGVSQGCGHDLSVGWLADMGGGDVYVATDLSQGAGNANGFGFLFDHHGDDQYVAHNAANTHGYGNPRRESGSLGLLVDRAGEDAYLAGARLRTGGKEATTATPPNDPPGVEVDQGPLVGLRLDLPGENPAPTAFADAPPLEVPGRAFTTQELFWMASTGQTRYEKQRDYALEELGRGSPQTLRFLAGELGNRDARDRQTIGLIAERIGPSAVHVFSDSLRSSSYMVRSMSVTALGKIRDPQVVPYLRGLLTDADWRIRYSAATALGASKDSAMIPDLRERLRIDPAPWVRVAALGGLDKLADPQIPAHLEAARRDPSFFVRLQARGLAPATETRP